MPTKIAILNQKGGVGKTTTAVTLASGFARQDCRVLLVDLDTQGNVANSLGLPHGDDLRRLLSPDLRCPIEQVIYSCSRLNSLLVRSPTSGALPGNLSAPANQIIYVKGCPLLFGQPHSSENAV